MLYRFCKTFILLTQYDDVLYYITNFYDNSVLSIEIHSRMFVDDYSPFMACHCANNSGQQDEASPRKHNYPKYHTN